MVVSSQPLGAALEQQVRRQEKDLAELIRIDADLNRRDAARLAAPGGSGTPPLRGQGTPSWSEFSRPHGASPRP